MRLLRVLASASALAALLTQPLAAQEGRQFKDSWFWGAKGGTMIYSSADKNTGVAPFVGADWMITRSQGGLYVSYDQVLLKAVGSFPDHDANGVAVDQLVDLSGVRRFSMLGMLFPAQRPLLHPYVGAGFAFNQVATATIEGTSARPAQALDSVQVKRTVFAPVFMGGVQARMPRFSVFGQVSASPTQQGYFLSRPDGRAFSLTFEGGIRYNVGTSIDKKR